MSFLKFSIFITIIICSTCIEEDYEKNTLLGNYYQLDDNTYKDLVFNITSNNSWLLIFYDLKCKFSRGALINLKRDILKHFYENKTLKFGVINVENQNCRKLTTRFNVRRVPHTAFIKYDKMYRFKQAFTPGKIIDFIQNLNVSNYEPVPKDPFEPIYINNNVEPLSFYEQSKLNFEEYIDSLNEPMQNFLDKFSIGIKWTNNKTYLAFIVFVILLFPTEYFILKFILSFFGMIKSESDIQIKNNAKEEKDKNKKKEVEKNKEIKSDKNKKEDIKETKDKNKKEKID